MDHFLTNRYILIEQTDKMIRTIEEEIMLHNIPMLLQDRINFS